MEDSKEQPIPKVEDKHHYFDDGKISRARHGECIILEVIPFSKISEVILDLWKKEVGECHRLYNSTTDYFIKASCEDDPNDMYFVRTLDGGWFSMGYWASRLDSIEGDLYNKMLKYEKGEY